MFNDNGIIFFADTSDIGEISKLHEYGLIGGVTTNPSLIAQSKMSAKELIKKICQMEVGHVSAEVISIDTAGMYKEAMEFAEISSDVVVNLPLTRNGLEVCQKLTQKGIKTNVTLCFSPIQANLAAKFGAYYVSPFIGRVEDAGYDGISLIEETKIIFENYNYKTKILATSIRSLDHIKKMLLLGVNVITIPPKMLWTMFEHPLTEKGLHIFLEDWAKAGATL